MLLMLLACAGYGYASYKDLAKKVEKLEASQRVLAAADRCKVLISRISCRVQGAL